MVYVPLFVVWREPRHGFVIGPLRLSLLAGMHGQGENSAMSYELCCFCGAETGRAGKSEDSIFFDDLGPFCEECYGKIKDGLEYDELYDDAQRLRAELAEANAMLDFVAEKGCFVRRHEGDNIDGTPNPTAWCVRWVSGGLFQEKIHEHYGATARDAIKAAMGEKP